MAPSIATAGRGGEKAVFLPIDCLQCEVRGEPQMAKQQRDSRSVTREHGRRASQLMCVRDVIRLCRLEALGQQAGELVVPPLDVSQEGCHGASQFPIHPMSTRLK